jgi:hypothetical protein
MGSNIRNADPGPNGWDFRDVRAWQSLDSWVFIPWANIKSIKSAGSATYAGDTEGKLVISSLQETDNHYRGSGIVINAAESQVVGCYKILELPRPDEWQELRADAFRLRE